MSLRLGDLMRIGAIWSRWIEVLADSLFAWREAWRSRCSLIVSHENDRFIVRRAGPGGNALIRETTSADTPESSPSSSALAVLSTGALASGELVRAARSGFVILELPARDIVVRRISVPVQAREFLSGIVRNQVERLSPWQVDQALYGFNADVNQDDGAAFD